MPEDERETLETTLAHFRGKREEMLGVLPLELRREWERLLGAE